MFLESIAKNILSKRLYDSIKKKYRRLKETYHKKLALDEFTEILIKELGIKSGSVVFVHSSIYNLFLDFETEKVLEILIKLVGDEGTLVFPCNQLQERAEVYLNSNKIFDVKKTLTKMGLLPGLAMFHSNSYRSLHPTNSCVAIGKHAKELLNEHHNSIYPCGEKSPYYKIMNYNGIIVGLGVSTESLTFVHVVEDVMKDKFPVQTRMKKIFDARVRDYDKNELIVKTLVSHENTGFRNVKKFLKKNIPQQISKDFKIKGIPFFRVEATGLFQKMMNLAEQNVTIYSKQAYLIKD